MAEENKKKPESKAKPAAAKPAAPKSTAKPEAPAKAAEASAAKAAGAKADARPRGKATPAVTDGPSCRADKCRQAVRAKGYCRKHYVAWRRGETGDHHRYKICSKEGCRKPRAKGGLCDEHAGTAAPAAAAAGGEGGATA